MKRSRFLMRCWRWWSREIYWWCCWRSSGFGRERRIRIWRLLCCLRVLVLIGFEFIFNVLFFVGICLVG